MSSTAKVSGLNLTLPTFVLFFFFRLSFFFLTFFQAYVLHLWVGLVLG